jgi:glycosyltransferase involved in cell wall biosynthesis
VRARTIAQIAYTGFGGLGSVIFSLVGADTLQSRRWVIGFIGDQPLAPDYRSRCEAAHIRHEAFRTVQGKPYAAWIRLAGWLRQTRPDVVICHSITAVLPCRWYAWLYRARLVVVEHTPNEVKTRREWAASRLAMLVADVVVVLTREYREQLAGAQGMLFRPGKVRIIPNGIDTRAFYARSDRAAANGLRLGMAARFSFTKRQDLLIEVMERIRERRPGLDVVLCLAGDGAEFERVRRRALGSPAAAAIQFEGLLPEHAVAPWLRSLDIYVHATDGETLSTSLLQAMATELPIVASDIPGVRNLLGEQADFGRCVANAPDDFVTAILECIDRPADASAMAARAGAQVAANYSHAAMLDRYVELFEDVGHSRA